MWLKPTDRPPTQNGKGGWTIRMMSQNSQVLVKVTDEALNDVAPPSVFSSPIFKYRGVFEEIADRKFLDHDFEDDGSITIRSADVRHV